MYATNDHPMRTPEPPAALPVEDQAIAGLAEHRLSLALNAAFEAARLYESLQPGDGRLTSVLALVAPQLEGTRHIPRRTLLVALDVARHCEAEAYGAAARAAAAAVVAVATAALALDAG
jgi:hypothetical protein